MIAGQTELTSGEVTIFDTAVDSTAAYVETFRVRNRSASADDAMICVKGMHGETFARIPPGESELFRVSIRLGGIKKVTAKAVSTAMIDHYPVVVANN